MEGRGRGYLSGFYFDANKKPIGFVQGVSLVIVLDHKQYLGCLLVKKEIWFESAILMVHAGWAWVSQLGMHDAFRVQRIPLVKITRLLSIIEVYTV